MRTHLVALLLGALCACGTPQSGAGSAQALTNAETRSLLRQFQVQRLMSDGVIVVSEPVLESFGEDGAVTRLGHRIREVGTYTIENGLVCTRTPAGHSECWRFYLDATGRYFTRAASGGELLPAQLDPKDQ